MFGFLKAILFIAYDLLFIILYIGIYAGQDCIIICIAQ